MALALLTIGIVLLISGVKGTQDDLITLVTKDFTGTDNFLQWILAFVLLGVIGYVSKLKPISVALLSLLIVVIFLTKGVGFFSQLQSAVEKA